MSGQSDEIVWQIINQQFCSFKLKTTKDQTFCRNEYNVTGLCNRQSCPLANSRYATIRQAPDTGALYLYMKTVERSHMPSKWWERIRLSKNYAEALEQVDQRLKFWPKFLVHKCKQRLTRLTQVSIRTKRLAREQARLGETLVPKLAPKVRRREQTRERKALAAAKVERAIERELIERLRSGAYGDRPLNVEEGIWKKVLRGLERAGAERDVDLDEGIEEEEEGEVEREYEREGDEALAEVEYVSDIEGDSDEEDGDVGDMEDGFDDWLDGRSADEDEDEQEGSDESVSGEQASGEKASEDSEEDEDIAALKKKLDSLKRKRPAKPSKPSKKPSRGSKGPKREIEYEFEKEPSVRQLVEA